jgi:hypothetical protein
MANPQHHNHSELIMPVYSEETFNYEILLRFGDTGLNKGKLTGASRTTITQTTKDGVPIGGGTNINPPEQLALIAEEEGEMLSSVLGAVNAATIIDNQSLTEALIAEQGKTAKLNNELIEVRAQIQDLSDQLAASKGEIARLTAPVAGTTLVAENGTGEPVGAV